MLILAVAASIFVAAANALKTPNYMYYSFMDYAKIGAGTVAGLFTASMLQASNNICFKNAVGTADTLIEYSVIAHLKDKDDLLEWLSWSVSDMGLLFAASKSAYYCLGTDHNFGWIVPLDITEMDFSNALFYPWTQDFIISLVSLLTSINLMATMGNSVDPFYIAKKFNQALWTCLMKFAEY